MTPKAFAAEVMRLWNDEVDNLDNYKTADNFKPNDDFIALQKKLLSLYYIKLLDGKYAQWYKVYHPTETLEFPKSVDAIRNAVSYNDSTLLSYSMYRDNIADYYQQKYKLNPSNDTAYISKVATILPASTLRDYLVYNKIKGLVARTRDSAGREMLIAKYLPVISQQKTQRQILALHYTLNSLTRGSAAPDFTTTALNKDTFSLKNFKGHYVVIDVWATWCRTCTGQSAIFEKIAEEYTNPSVAFVALSIDDSRWEWQNEASQRSLRVFHLRSNNKDLFNRSYGIDYMPRYILIDPDGKILNAQMPEPSNPAFIEILKKEIPGMASL
jgi:peroxiredoxin